MVAGAAQIIDENPSPTLTKKSLRSPLARLTNDSSLHDDRGSFIRSVAVESIAETEIFQG